VKEIRNSMTAGSSAITETDKEEIFERLKKRAEKQTP
jgi:hypothetical protein